MINEQVIREVIDSFFKGVDYFDEPIVGRIWVAKHGEKKVNRFDLQAVRERGFIEPPFLTKIVSEDTMWGYIPEFEILTIEPRTGGQYEIAVRIWSENKWRGYMINDLNDLYSTYLIGVNMVLIQEGINFFGGKKKMEICGVCKKEFDAEKDGGIKQDDKVVCATCVRNHPYQTNRFLK